MIFKNRRDAGRELAEKLLEYAGREDLVVLALPRGGVPVAFEVARRLRVPLDVFLVRKLGVPGQEELAMGAIASNAVRVLNRAVIRYLNVPDNILEAITAKEQLELNRREKAYRDNLPPPRIKGKTVILIDDGLATGATMRAAAQALKGFEPGKAIIAVPVAAAETCQDLRHEADEVICAVTPTPFRGVGLWYEDFSQVPDDEVRSYLQKARDELRSGEKTGRRPVNARARPVAEGFA